MHATDPVEITLLDGRVAALRLTMAGLRRLMARSGAKSVQGLWESQGELVVIGVLYEALPGDLRETMTEEEFADLLPASSLKEIAEVVAKLFGSNSQSPFAAPPQT
jgi:hypothetical protein